MVRAVHIVVWLLVLLIALVAPTSELLPVATATILGLLLFVLGFAIFAWAVAYLRTASLGVVAPVTEELAMVGAYRLVRHPQYLGIVVALVGLTVALRSLWALAATLVLFVPVSICRAKLEERAVARRFGALWDDYVSRTKFLIPGIY